MLLGSPACLSNSMVTPFHAPVTWSLSASMTLNEGSSLQTGFLDSATRDVDQYQKLSFTDSLDLVIPQKLMQQPMPSVLRRMPTPVAEVLALAPAPAPAPAPAEQKGFRIEKLSLFIEQISSMHAQDPVSAKSKLTGALEILFEFKEKNPEMLEFLFDIPDGALEMGDFTQDDLGLWFDILRDENIQGNLNSTVSFSDLSRLSDVCGRMVRSSEMNAPSVMQLPNMRRLLSALRRLVKPEVVLFLDRAQYALVGKAIKEHSLLAQFPNQAKRIASLIEMSLYETRVAYKEQEISMLKLFDLCSQENKKALADSLLAIINTASPRQTEALIEFMLVRCPILGFNSSIDNLIQVIEDSSGGRVQVISNNHFLAASVKKIVTDLRSSMELSSESFVFDDAGEFASLELSSIMEAFELLGKLLVYNPSFEFLNIMIRECVSPKSHNPMMWLLKNIPKRTMTRDARRYFGSYILMTFKQYLLGKFSPHNEWDAQLIGAFDALDREWAHSHAARALAQDEETREDVAMQAELLAEEALRLSTDGHDHYRELKKLGYQFSSFEEFKEKYQVLKNLFNVFVKCINRNLPSREAQQDTALAFIEFCRIMSNFATLLPELEIDVLLSQLQIMKKERGQKEFLLAADIRAFTEQLKQIALERFFEKSSLSEKTQQTIRSAISDPNNPLSDIRLLNQIIAYHGFQTEKGQQAVEELLESLTVEQKRKKGIRPDQADVKVSYTENYLPEQYLEILNSLFEHLGVSSVSEISQADLQDIIDEIETALRKGEAIDAYEVKAWKDAILSLKDKLIRYNIDEVLFDLDKLIAISEQPVERTVKDYNFFITGDLISVLKAGEEPQRTCQRISSAGAYNSNGQPVYRALHPHVSMAGLKDPVTGKIVARVILEYVEPGIVLVERHYLGSHVTRMQFDQLLLTMLSKNRNIKSVVFADNPIIGEGSKHVVSVGKLPEDYYRDTYRSDRDYMAVNIKDYRIKAQIMGRWGFEV